MNKTQPNLDLLYDKVLDFNEAQPSEYFDSVLYYLSENTSQIHNIFDNLTSVFANNPSLLNALKIVLLFVVRLGAPAFFGLEGSRIPELNLDPTTQHEELLELKRIMKYCLEKFQRMQTSHEIPNIGQKYAELCQIAQEEVSIGEIQLTEFEQQYSELSVKFQQFEQRLEILVSECQDNKDSKLMLENTKGVQLLEQIDGLVIQPEQGFTKSENELILNFFHQKYALINKIHNELPQVGQEYQKVKEEKKAKKQQEKGEEEQKPPQDSQIQNIRDFTSFVEGTSLAAFPESMSIEYKDYIYPFRNEELRKKLKATMCAFLNTNGGRILIGVGNIGFRVKGLFLTTNDQDTLIRDIDTLLKDFHPKVDPEEVITTFIPIKKKDNTYKPGFYIVKILVKRGKPNDLYFVGRDCYKRRNGQNDVQMPSNFKKDIIDRVGITIQTHPEFFRDRGEFNDPAPELGIPITNVKEKRTLETKPAKPIGGIKQKQGVPIVSVTTKLLVKNVPNKPDVGLELKTLLDPLQPLSKTLHFTKDNDIVVTFLRPEEAKTFLDYVEGNPLVIGSNTLQFTAKPLEKEKPEKSKVKVEVEEEKKDPLKVKSESSNIIWVRGIPENTTDLKEKLTVLVGEFAPKLKDIKIHNKKKRATLEFESSIQANEVLNYLNLAERFIGENKVTFEKASPPSSPSQATKPSELKPSEITKAKEIVKTVDPAKPKETKKAEIAKDTTKTAETEVPQVETNVLKISNLPLEDSSQEIGYLVKACSHHIKKSMEKKITKDCVLFTFKDKDDAVKAHSFLTQNNLSFRGKKLKVEYYTPPQKTETPKPKSVKAQTSSAQPTVAVPSKQEPVGPGQNVQTGNVMQPETQGHDPNMLDLLIQQQQQFNPFMIQSNNSYHGDPNFYSTPPGIQFNTPFDAHQQGVDPSLRTTEVVQPDSIQFDLPNDNSLSSDPQQQQQYVQPQNQSGFGVKNAQQNLGPQLAEAQPSNANLTKNSLPTSQPVSQSIDSQNKEFIPIPIGPHQYAQNQFNQPNVRPTSQGAPGQTNFMQDPKLLNQQNLFQYHLVGAPQQNIPQGNLQTAGSTQGSLNNLQTQVPEQLNKPGMTNQGYQNQQVHPNYYSQFPQQQINQQLGNMQPNQILQNGQYPMQQSPHLNKNQQPQYQQGMNPIQNSNFNSHWPQNQTQAQNQPQQFPGYPHQQFNQGQQYPQQQNINPQFQQMNPQGQYLMQQGQYPMQTGQFTGQTTQYPFPGGFNTGNVKGGQMDQTNQGNPQQIANLQVGKNSSNPDTTGKKQAPQNPLQNQGQGHMPALGNQQNFGTPSYYSGYPQSHMPGNFSYGQQAGYNQNQNAPNGRPDMMYQNAQGNMQGNLQPIGGNQGLTPQQLQQLQMQQMQYGGIQPPQYVGSSAQANTKCAVSDDFKGD